MQAALGPRPNFVGIRRPQVLAAQSAREPSREWSSLKESSHRSSLRETSNTSLRERSLGSQENWSTSLKGLCTYRDWNRCPRLDHKEITHTTHPSTARGNESSSQADSSVRLRNSRSFLSKTKQNAPLHSLTMIAPLRSPSTYSAPRYSDRTGAWHTPKNERGWPHTLGRPYTSVGTSGAAMTCKSGDAK